MAKKYYVVWKGRQAGIFTTWDDCKAQVDGFAGARYKSFPTKEEAEKAFGKPANKVIFNAAKGPKKSHAGGKNKLQKVPLNDETIAAMPYEYKLYTDGASEPNPGEAGSGVAVYHQNQLTELWYGIYEPVGTNNSAELHALNQALMMAKPLLAQDKSVAIYSDSSYSIQCITTWAKGWKAKGWKKSSGEIKNLELIQSMFALYQEMESQLKIYHVNGHVGVEGNELADRMSILAIEAKETQFAKYNQPLDIEEILALRRG